MLSVFAIKAPISSSLQTNRFCTRLVNAKSAQTLEIQANLRLTLQIAYEQEGKVIEGLKICALSLFNKGTNLLHISFSTNPQVLGCQIQTACKVTVVSDLELVFMTKIELNKVKTAAAGWSRGMILA